MWGDGMGSDFEKISPEKVLFCGISGTTGAMGAGCLHTSGGTPNPKDTTFGASVHLLHAVGSVSWSRSD